MKIVGRVVLGVIVFVVAVAGDVGCAFAARGANVIQNVEAPDYVLPEVDTEKGLAVVPDFAPERVLAEPGKILEKRRKKSHRWEKKFTKEHRRLEPEIIATSNDICKLIYERGMLYKEEKVLRYINGVAGRIAEHSDFDSDVKIEVKIIRDPLVNAFAMANGAIHMHTGALACLKSEAQLAFLLAHEMSHISEKDVISNTKSSHEKIIAFKLFDIVLSPAAVFFGLFGDLAQFGVNLLHVSTITGYSRNIEARADRDGILWASEEGYHPQEAAAMLDIFLREKEKYRTGEEIYFLMSHPSNKWRRKQLDKVISKKYAGVAVGEVNETEFLLNMVSIKLYNAKLNMKMDRLVHAEDNVKWVLENFPENSKARNIAAEIYRLEAEDLDKVKRELNSKEWKKLTKGLKKEALKKILVEKARDEYKEAVRLDGAFPDARRGLGLLNYDLKEKDEALANFEKYLELSPNVKDKRYINFMIRRIHKEKNKEKQGAK